MTLRWRKDPKETGLRSVGAAPQGHKLYLVEADKEDYIAWVSPFGGSWRGPLEGWYWVVPSDEKLGLEFRNTHATPVATEKEAKDAAKKYVLECMAAHNANKGT